MKSISSAVVLALASVAAHAQWTTVASTREHIWEMRAQGYTQRVAGKTYHFRDVRAVDDQGQETLAVLSYDQGACAGTGVVSLQLAGVEYPYHLPGPLPPILQAVFLYACRQR